MTIIIPIHNEAKFLKAHADYYRKLAAAVRVVFVDGASQDDTVALAREFGQVVPSPKGRGRQKNLGAQHASDQTFLFLHVDAMVNIDDLQRLENELSNQNIAAVCLTMVIDDRRKIFRVFERMINWRAQAFGCTDGDSGLLIRKSVFDAVNGFDEVLIMEDIFMGRKLSRHGKIKLSDCKIHVSSRKWREDGFFRTLSVYATAYFRGVRG